jgi:hypothetical protein
MSTDVPTPEQPRTSLIQNPGGGPKWLGIRCTCGWKTGHPGQRRDSLERAGRRHTKEAHGTEPACAP